MNNDYYVSPKIYVAVVQAEFILLCTFLKWDTVLEKHHTINFNIFLNQCVWHYYIWYDLKPKSFIISSKVSRIKQMISSLCLNYF